MRSELRGGRPWGLPPSRLHGPRIQAVVLGLVVEVAGIWPSSRSIFPKKLITLSWRRPTHAAEASTSWLKRSWRRPACSLPAGSRGGREKLGLAQRDRRKRQERRPVDSRLHAVGLRHHRRRASRHHRPVLQPWRRAPLGRRRLLLRRGSGERCHARVLLDTARMAVSGVDPAALVFALELQNAASPTGVIEETNREVWSKPVPSCAMPTRSRCWWRFT